MDKKYRGYTLQQVAQTIDHSVLKPDSTYVDIEEGAQVAATYHTASFCIRPCDVSRAAAFLAGSGVPVCTVIGFPHGTCTTATKVFESLDALKNGASELDMVINVAALLSADFSYVQNDIKAVVDAAHSYSPPATVKVIFETCLLNEALIVKACELCEAAGADYVKTSTGFGSQGASLPNVQLMKSTVGDRIKVKSSGGVRTLDQLIDFMDAGVSRSGCSATKAVLAEFVEKATV